MSDALTPQWSSSPGCTWTANPGQSTKVSRRSANGDGRVHIWVTTRWMSMSSMARMTPKKAVGT